MKQFLSLGLISACLAAGSAFCMDQQKQPDWGKNAYVLQQVKPNNIIFKYPLHAFENQSLEEKQKLVGYPLDHLTFTGNEQNPDSVTIDLTAWELLKKPKQPSVFRKFIDPVTLSVGAACILATWYLTKNSGTPQ